MAQVHNAHTVSIVARYFACNKSTFLSSCPGSLGWGLVKVCLCYFASQYLYYVKSRVTSLSCVCENSISFPVTGFSSVNSVISHVLFVRLFYFLWPVVVFVLVAIKTIQFAVKFRCLWVLLQSNLLVLWNDIWFCWFFITSLDIANSNCNPYPPIHLSMTILQICWYVNSSMLTIILLYLLDDGDDGFDDDFEKM